MENNHTTKSVLQSINLPKACRVTITIANGADSSFTGSLHSVDQTAGKITLKNVTTDGVKLSGPQIYYCKDILDLQIVSDVQNVTESPTDKKTKKSQEFKQRKCQPAHLTRLKHIDDDALVLSNILRDELGDPENEDVEFEDYYETAEYTLICRVCEKFDEAIEYIMKQEAVGLAVEGQKLGRDGILSLVQIATDSELIVFDILRLGDEAFKAGLQAVFEAADVMKVMHDCRWIADLLRWQHDISMVNVFDTQVANAFVYRGLNSGDWPRYVESLPGCLISYLNLPPQDVQFTKVRERCREKDEAVWLVRPLPEKLLAAATKNTIHLLELQRVLLVEMLAEYKAAVGIYLNHVSGTAEDVEKSRVNSHLLPIAFTYIHAYVKGRSGRERTDPQCGDRKGFRENNVALPDRSVVFSHDSVWHKANGNFGKVFPEGCPVTERQRKPKMASAPAEEKGRSSPVKPSNIQRSPDKSKVNREIASSGDKERSPMKGISLFQDKSTCDGKAKTFSSIGSLEASNSIPFCKDARHKDGGPELEPVTNEGLISDTEQHRTSRGAASPGKGSRNCSLSESASESNAVSPINSKNVGQTLQKSGLWKMMIKEQQEEQESSSSPSISKVQNGSPLKQPAAQPPVLNNHHHHQTMPHSLPDNDISEQEEEEAKEFKRIMALLDQLHFVPKTGTASPKSSKVDPSKDPLPDFLSDSSSSTTRCQNHNAPESQKSSSLGSSDSDGSHPFSIPLEADLGGERDLSCSAFIPAGMQEGKPKKSKKKHQEPSLSTATELARTRSTSRKVAAAKELDFSLIPTPHALSRRKEHALGVSSIGIGNPFSEDEGFSTPSPFSSSAFLKSRLLASCAGGGDETISDDELDKLLKSEKSQRILKFVSSNSNTNVRDKILPVPAKLKSPSSGS